MMQRKYIVPYLVMVPVIFFQVIVAPIISLEDIVPDLLIIFIVFYTLKLGQLYGTVLGAVAGLAYDLVTGSMLGSSMFAYTLSAFITGYFFNENKILTNIKSFRFPFIVLTGAVVSSSALLIIASFDIHTNLLHVLIEQGIVPAVYTAFLGSIITFLYPRRSYEWQM